MATYSVLSTKFSPCDLLLFRGSDFISKTIMKVESYEVGYGEYSHVGMVVNSDVLPHIPQLKKGRWYVLESTCTIPYVTDGVPDVRTKATRFGVQIRDLELVVNNYEKKGVVAWAKLNNNPWHKDKKHTAHKMDKVVNEVGWKPYEYRLINLIAAAFPWFRRGRLWFDEFESEAYHALSTLGFADDKTPKQVEEMTLFCSQLVALVYRALGVISHDIDPSDVMPVEFLRPRIKSMEGVVQDPIVILPQA